MKDKINTLLSQAYFIGGSPCSGKSTLTGALSNRFNLPVYKIDDHEQAHMARSQPDQQPVMYALTNMNWDQIWMRPVALQVEQERQFYRERWQMILEDLSEFDDIQPIIIEGAALLPELLAQYQISPKRVLYLIPTLTFQRKHYEKRPWINHILRDCTDPTQAFDNWMQRDHLFGQEIAKQAAVHNYCVIVVDGSIGVASLLETAVVHFKDSKG